MAMITLFCKMCLAGFIEGLFVVTPRDTLVRLGDTTQLNCTFTTVVSDNCAWYKGRGAKREAVTLGRDPAFEEGDFEIVDSKDDREYSLRLFNIIRENEDIYECGNILTGQRSSAHVYVIDTGPTCEVFGSTTAIAGEERTFVCKINLNASAPGELVWIEDNREMNRQEGQANEWTTRLSKVDNNVTFDCQLQHMTVPSWQWSNISCKEKITFDVQYPPDVSVDFTSQGPLMEGDTFIANCTSNDANPAKIDDVYWKDSADNRVAETEDLVLENVTRGRKGEYTCVMSNTFYNGKRGRGSASIKIHVHYSPNITTIDTIFRAGIGEVVEIVCEVDSFPAPTIMWYDNSSNAITNDDDNIQTTLGDSGELRRSTLTITVVDESYYGIYTCKAFNNIPPNATSTVTIIKQDSSLESSSLTIVAVAAASGAVFLIALAVVIALCWHRRNSNKQRRESSSTIPSPAMPSTAAESSDILDGEGERYVICTSKGGDEEKSNSYQNVLELTESSRDQIIDQNRVKGGTDAGLQNSTTKAELTYAELDLTDSGSGQQRFKRDPREKTQYAQIQISKGKGKNRKRK